MESLTSRRVLAVQQVLLATLCMAAAAAGTVAPAAGAEPMHSAIDKLQVALGPAAEAARTGKVHNPPHVYVRPGKRPQDPHFFSLDGGRSFKVSPSHDDMMRRLKEHAKSLGSDVLKVSNLGDSAASFEVFRARLHTESAKPGADEFHFEVYHAPKAERAPLNDLIDYNFAALGEVKEAAAVFLLLVPDQPRRTLEFTHGSSKTELVVTSHDASLVTRIVQYIQAAMDDFRKRLHRARFGGAQDADAATTITAATLITLALDNYCRDYRMSREELAQRVNLQFGAIKVSDAQPILPPQVILAFTASQAVVAGSTAPWRGDAGLALFVMFLIGVPLYLRKAGGVQRWTQVLASMVAYSFWAAGSAGPPFNLDPSLRALLLIVGGFLVPLFPVDAMVQPRRAHR